jgi:hypothetical protein
MTTSVGHRIIDLQLLELDYLRGPQAHTGGCRRTGPPGATAMHRVWRRAEEQRVIEPPTIFNSAISRSG